MYNGSVCRALTYTVDIIHMDEMPSNRAYI